MVACADYSYAFIVRVLNSFWPIIGSGSIYLYLILRSGRMKKIFLIILLVFLICIAIYRHNTDPKIVINRFSGIILHQNNPQLHYRIFAFGVFPIAEAVFYPEKEDVYQGKTMAHLRAVANTLPVISNFFQAQAEADSYVDLQDRNPGVFLQQIKVKGKPDVYKKIVYDQKRGVMSLNKVERSILPSTQDFLSAIYKIENMDFEAATNLEMSINTNQKNYVLLASAALRTALVRRAAYKLYILNGEIKRRDKNNPYHTTKIRMILVKGKTNIPVIIKVSASGFPLTARLVYIK